MVECYFYAFGGFSDFNFVQMETAFTAEVQFCSTVRSDIYSVFMTIII